MRIVQFGRQMFFYFATMDQMFELLRSLSVVMNHPLSKGLISRDFFLQVSLLDSTSNISLIATILTKSAVEGVGVVCADAAAAKMAKPIVANARFIFDFTHVARVEWLGAPASGLFVAGRPRRFVRM